MNVSRRQALVGSLALGTASIAAAATTTSSRPTALARPAGAVKGVGLQLYTVRDAFQRDPVATLERVARIGYRELEYGGGGYDTMDAAMLRRVQDRLGLTAPAIHVPYQQVIDQPTLVIDRARTLGTSLIVVPFIDTGLRTLDAWRGVTINFNRFGERVKRAGIQFAYHNHMFEFTMKHGSKSLFDLLLDERDPALVKIELDLFWAIAAGEDPNALIDRLAGSIAAYHVKDRTRDGVMVSVGAGVIDFAAIFARNDQAGVQHLFVEHDYAAQPYRPDEFASVEFSYATMRQLGY